MFHWGIKSDDLKTPFLASVCVIYTHNWSLVNREAVVLWLLLENAIQEHKPLGMPRSWSEVYITASVLETAW